MELKHLIQPPFNTTLMGVAKGILDHFGIAMSNAMAFGSSGHAFLINIHDVICPSGPYCWNYDGFFRLLGNMGLAVDDLGFFMPDSTTDQRDQVERSIRRQLDLGNPCSILNMENQIIRGYDDHSLYLCQPWPGCTDLTPATLTFGTWSEFGPNYHCNFFAFRQTGSFDRNTAIAHSLEYAIDLFRNPGRFTSEPYVAGLQAYDQWIRALKEGHGGDHGNWWNGMVWSECRKMAAIYMEEIGQLFGEKPEAEAGVLSSGYFAIAQNLELIGNCELDVHRKIDLLAETREIEASLLPRLESLRSMLPV